MAVIHYLSPDAPGDYGSSGSPEIPETSRNFLKLPELPELPELPARSSQPFYGRYLLKVFIAGLTLENKSDIGFFYENRPADDVPSEMSKLFNWLT